MPGLSLNEGREKCVVCCTVELLMPGLSLNEG